MSTGGEGAAARGEAVRHGDGGGPAVEAGDRERRGYGRRGGSDDTSETNQTLWLLAASPTIWAVHFLACYITAAVWCARVVGGAGPLDGVRGAVAAYTAVALVGIAITGWMGFRRHRHGTGARPHDFDTPEDRHRFLGFATVLLSGLSAVAVLYVAAVALWFETCL